MEVLQRTANRGSLSTGYDIDNSLKLEPDNSELLYREEATAGNMRTWTISLWIKRTELSYNRAFMYSQQAYGNISFNSSDQMVVENHNLYLITSRVFRDTSAWYHIVWVNDSTQSTAANRTKIYINGVQETAFGTETYQPQNEEGKVNTGGSGGTGRTYIGRSSAETKFFAGYIAEFYKIDGTALAPTDFGEFDDDSGIWIPKEYIPTSWGTQGNSLNFSNSSSLGTISGNGDNYYLENITAADQATDSPTNSFCTWNPLWVYATQPTISDGATKTFNSSTDWTGAKSTFGLTKGKWYWEYKALNYNALLGIQTDGESNISASGNAQSKLSTLALFLQGEVEIVDSGGSRDDTNVTFTFDAAHTFGIALDMDSSTQIISFYQNGSLITNGGNINIDGLADQTVFPFVATLNNTVTINFGGYTSNSISSAASDENGYGTFEYAPPSGYYALCTKNLAEYG